jgi:hypothetical protein
MATSTNAGNWTVIDDEGLHSDQNSTASETEGDIVQHVTESNEDLAMTGTGDRAQLQREDTMDSGPVGQENVSGKVAPLEKTLECLRL